MLNIIKKLLLTWLVFFFISFSANSAVNIGQYELIDKNLYSLKHNGGRTNRRTGEISDVYILTNTSADVISGSLMLEVDITPSNASDLNNKDDVTNTGTGIIYLPVELLLPEQSYTYTLNFSSPGRQRFTYEQNLYTLNYAPDIISTPIVEANEEQAYQYNVEAIDKNNEDVLVYSLTKAPEGAVISESTGVIEWSPTTKYKNPIQTFNSQCRLDENEGVFDPVLKWHWKGPSINPSYNDVFGPVSVAQFNDDNGDGSINHLDYPDIAFTSGNTSSNNGVLNIIDGKSGEEIFSSGIIDVSSYASLAVADIDNDGFVEIVVVGSNRRDKLHVFEHTGELKWSVSTGPSHRDKPRDAVALADIDNDGDVEIIQGSRVFDHLGNLLWVGSHDSGGYKDYGYLSFSADINLDGKQEIIAGRTVYDFQGNVLWHNSSIPSDGFNAVGNFDDDDYAEIVLVSNGKTYLLDQDGTTIWSSAITGGGYGGAPTVADFDGDGMPEIGVAGSNYYILYESDGTIKWENKVQDASSNRTGSSVFDFDLDGRSEVLYADEINFYVFEGVTGNILLEIPNISGTTLEYPVIADIDKDNNAEILVGSNFGSISTNGLRAYESASSSWAPTRALWNQHAYNVDNINDDFTVPEHPKKSWLTHNTFRLNTFTEYKPSALADLSLANLAIEHDAGQIAITLDVINRGLAPVKQPFSVDIFSNEPDKGGELIASQLVNSLSQESSQKLHLSVATPLVSDLYARVDFQNEISECIEDNNYTISALVNVKVSDSGGLFDEQLYALSVTPKNTTPIILNSNTFNLNPDENFTFQIQAYDSDIGDALFFELHNAPIGMVINKKTGLITWQPNSSQVDSYNVVLTVTDLQGKIAEQELLFAVLAPINLPPVITSEPLTSGVVNQNYQYKVNAYDPENNGALTYELTIAPDNATINNETGEIIWVADNTGNFEFSVNVTDVEGASTQQAFSVQVGNFFEITSTPSLEASTVNGYSYTIETDGTSAQTYQLVSGPVGANIIGNEITWLPIHTKTIEPDETIQACVNYDDLILGSAGSHALKVESHHMADVLPVLYGAIPDSISDTTDIENQKTITTLARDLAGQGWFSEYETFAYTTQAPSWEGFLTRLVVRGGGEELLGFPHGSYSYSAPSDREHEDRVLGFQNDTWSRRLSHRVCERENNFGVINGHNNIGWENCVVEDWGAFSVIKNIGQPSKWQADLTIAEAVVQNENQVSWVVKNRGLATSSNYQVQVFEKVNARFELVHTEDYSGANAGASVSESYTHDVKFSGDVRVAIVPLDEQLECVTNNSEVDLYKFDVEAESVEGIKAQQSFWLSTIDQNLKVVSAAPDKVYQNSEYIYRSTTTGGTGNYTYEISGPAEAAVNETGEVSWTPNITDFGVFELTLQVTDEQNISTSQTFSITVLEAQDNTAPEVVSIPPKYATVGEEYRYELEAVDSEGDAITYQISDGSSLAVLSDNVLTWTSTRAEYDWRRAHNIHDLNPSGAYQTFEVEVKDEHGLIGRHRWVVYLNLPSGTPVEVPEIISEPTIQVNAGEIYNYQVEVNDSSGTELNYALTRWPEGMAIDESGLIMWTTEPTWHGEFLVDVGVSNQVGGYSNQSFYLTILPLGDNAAPIVTSTPSTRTLIDEHYVYQVVATDSDNDTLTYQHVNAPSGMTIHSQTGLLFWTPTVADLGEHNVAIAITDGRGAEVTQSFVLTVTDGAATNNIPQITSTPNSNAIAGLPYQYQVQATDIDGDVLSYALSVAPTGMTISATGLVEWLPESSHIGAHSIGIKVSDGQGGVITQAFELNVNEDMGENQLPTITSTPLNVAEVNQQYLYQVVATDSDNDELTYTLIAAPADMTISTDGLVSWLPIIETLENVVVRISDTYGYAEQSWSIDVVESNTELSASISISEKFVEEDAQITIQVIPTNVSELISVELNMNGQTLMLDESYSVRVTASELGVHYLEAVVIDDTAVVTVNGYFFVRDPTENASPIIESKPPKKAKTEKRYEYQVIAVDPENDEMTYAIFNAPAGMTITESGLISWQATEQDVGLYTVTIEVTDSENNTTQQLYKLMVTAPGKYNRRLCRITE